MSSKKHCSKTIRHRFVCRSPARSMGVEVEGWRGGTADWWRAEVGPWVTHAPLHNIKNSHTFLGRQNCPCWNAGVFFSSVMSSICFILIDGTLRRIHIIAKLRNCLPFMPGCPIDRCWRTSWQLRKGRLQENGSKPTATQWGFLAWFLGGDCKEHFGTGV